MTSSCVAGAGNYQLLFGVYSRNGSVNRMKPAALVVKCVCVPEEHKFSSICVGLSQMEMASTI